uniref:Uncharacterized protein n=1 Tax=Anguilla anguilla TaxID=7936 RepID=A0A0E9SDS2_ANGAN
MNAAYVTKNNQYLHNSAPARECSSTECKRRFSTACCISSKAKFLFSPNASKLTSA